MLDVDQRLKSLEHETASLRTEIALLKARLAARRTASPLPAVIVPSRLTPLHVVHRRHEFAAGDLR